MVLHVRRPGQKFNFERVLKCASMEYLTIADDRKWSEYRFILSMQMASAIIDEVFGTEYRGQLTKAYGHKATSGSEGRFHRTLSV